MGLLEEFPDLPGILARNELPVRCEKPTIMLAMTPRTGSTHLCAALATAAAAAAAGEFLPPGEIFNPRGPVQNAKFWCHVFFFADYMRSFSKQPGVYFMFKASWHDYRIVSSLTGQMFPDLKVIYLDRLDIVAQAVSLFRAMTTKLWHRHPGRERQIGARDETVPEDEIRAKFDLAHICKIIDDLEAERQGWKRFFKEEGIEPLRISYEGFSDDVQTAVRYIGAALGLKLDKPIGPEAGYVKMADQINEEWIAKVRAYRAGHK